jgi:hypothetical protein
MKKLFTIIISGFVFLNLSAQQFSGANFETVASVQAQSINITHTSDAQDAAKAGIDNVSEMPQIRVYPNPAEDRIQISVNDKMIGNTIRVYSLLGSEMMSHYIGSGQDVLDISALSRGLYLYGIIDKNSKTILSGKFNKQ